jgi:hypothetical protein
MEKLLVEIPETLYGSEVSGTSFHRQECAAALLEGFECDFRGSENEDPRRPPRGLFLAPFGVDRHGRDTTIAAYLPSSRGISAV